MLKKILMDRAYIARINEGNFVAKYSSQREAERLTGASHYGIRDCIKGKYKSYKGFIWSDSPPVCEVTDD